MKSIRVILVFVSSLLALQGILARTTHKSKNEDRYMTIENDISNGAPVLPLEGGYKDPENAPSELSYEDIKRLYGMGNIYGSDGGYDSGIPYYYYAYNPKVIYDPKSPFYIGSDYDLTNPYPADFAPEHYVDINEDVPDGTIISESEGIPEDEDPEAEYEDVSVIAEEPTTQDVEIPEEDQVVEQDAELEESVDVPDWVNHETNSNTESYFDNYMMGLPAQLQSFAMFNPEYFQPEYAEYERLAAENERRHEELQAQGLDANTVDNPVNFPRGGRAKRGFAKVLNLRDRNIDGSAHFTGNKEKANCRGNGYGNGGRRPNPADVGDVGNGVADAAGTVQNAAGQVSGAAGDAVDAATNAAENLRLANNGRRTNNRRNGNNNRNNGRRVE